MAHTSPPSHGGYTNLDMRITLPHDNNFASLDDTVMDSESNNSSASFRPQRNSVDVGVAHPSTTTWGGDYHFQHDPSSLPQTQTAIGSFPDTGNYPQHKPSDVPHTTFFSSQHGLWLSENSGSCTPTRNYMGPECENSASLASFANHLGQPTPTTLSNPLDPHEVDANNSNQTSRMSPQLGKEWVSMSSTDQVGGDWSVLSESHPSSPSHIGSIDVLRRDGIRKKNTRFEIPAERNLQTIDKLISTTTDEHQIKELKQQKRLLRNRQAALDSRQRKKQHTERLEEEKKSFTNYIHELEEEIVALRVRDQDWQREKQQWAISQQNCQHYIESLTMEKDEIIRNFTVETGELRRKNLYLADQIRHLESAAAMSTAPSSTGFSTDFSEFDHVTVQSSPWEHFSSINDFSIENEQPAAPMMSTPSEPAKPLPKPEDVSTTSSLFLLLLLCGAWVASRNPQTNPALPRMPDDVRMASATVLDHLYQDAGIDPRRPSEVKGNDISSFEAAHTGQVSKMGFASPRQQQESPLDSLHRHLTTATEDQMREQALSLTPGQYHGISADTTFDSTKPFPSSRRSLQDSLAALRRQSQVNSVDSYARSILWDRLPKDIVKDFARIVAENGHNTQPWKIEPGS